MVCCSVDDRPDIVDGAGPGVAEDSIAAADGNHYDLETRSPASSAAATATTSWFQHTLLNSSDLFVRWRPPHARGPGDILFSSVVLAVGYDGGGGGVLFQATHAGMSSGCLQTLCCTLFARNCTHTGLGSLHSPCVCVSK
jgi:hypothetical protein